MPYIRCKVVPNIDYLATYSQPCTYFHSPNTALSFFEYDVVFDGLYGLWNAIYYGVEKLQEFYLERFQGIKYYIAPDYSKCGDIPEIENTHRQFRSRIVAIWLTMNLQAVVIPLVSCADESSLKYMLDGMQDCNVVAFNAKGPMGDPEQLEIFINAIRYTVDHLPCLQSIIVYSASPDIDKVQGYFQYASDAGIEIQIPCMNNKLLYLNLTKIKSVVLLEDACDAPYNYNWDPTVGEGEIPLVVDDYFFDVAENDVHDTEYSPKLQEHLNMLIKEEKWTEEDAHEMIYGIRIRYADGSIVDNTMEMRNVAAYGAVSDLADVAESLYIYGDSVEPQEYISFTDWNGAATCLNKNEVSVIEMPLITVEKMIIKRIMKDVKEVMKERN